MNSWSDLLPLPTLVELLDQHFFPKWLKTLTMWINMNPNHEQISNWYTGWKSLMPAIIVEHPTIKGRFHSALDIMSRAVGGPSMPLPPPPPTIHVSGSFLFCCSLDTILIFVIFIKTLYFFNYFRVV